MKYRKNDTGLIYHAIDADGCITTYSIITTGITLNLHIAQKFEPLKEKEQELFHDSTHAIEEDAFYRFLAEFLHRQGKIIDQHLPTMQHLNKLNLNQTNNP